MLWLYLIVGICAFDAGFVAGAFWHSLCRRNREAEEANRRLRRLLLPCHHLIGVNEFPPEDAEAIREAMGNV